MVSRLFPKINDIQVKFILLNNNFESDNFILFEQQLKDYLFTSNTKQKVKYQFINKNTNKLIKEYEIEYNVGEEPIYFKRNVINMLSSDENDVIKNQYKVICVGKKTSDGKYDLMYYHFEKGIEIKSSDINFIPIL